jgi:hypothetical protein
VISECKKFNSCIAAFFLIAKNLFPLREMLDVTC